MRDKELYQKIMGIHSPWKVSEVELLMAAGEVKVHVEQEAGAQQRCPQCGMHCPGHDKRLRTWRHLDTCQFKTLLVAKVSRVECPKHGVVTVKVPWAEPGSGSTALL